MIIEVEREPSRWTLTLNRPEKANALSGELVEALIAAVAEAESSSVPVLAFRGAGRNFSAGFDFADLEQQSEGDLLLRFVRIEMLLQSVARSSCLTVGFAHGRNFGAGVDLFAACRWRIAAPQATFRMPGLGFGLVLGTRRFAAIAGRDAAREILEGLRTFDADAARALGLARNVAPEEDWPAILRGAEDTAATISSDSRALLYQALDPGSHDTDLALLARSAAAPGLKQRIRDYLEKTRRG